jgi:hypothetical protein
VVQVKAVSCYCKPTLGEIMMKRIVTASGAVLGMAAAALSATPAQAAPVVAACDDYTDHTLAGVEGDNWYMECVPQYGMGKASFTIDGSDDQPLPAGLDLTAVDVVETSGYGAAATAYGMTTDGSVFANLQRTSDGASANRQVYEATMAFRIAGVERVVDQAELPADCLVGANTYGSAFKVTYAPSTVGLSQVVDGETWDFDVTATPAPLYLAFTAVAGAFATDSTTPACAASGTPGEFSYVGVSGSSGFQRATQGGATVGNVFGSLVTLSPYLYDNVTGYPDSFGAFSRVVAAPPVVTPPVVAPPVDGSPAAAGPAAAIAAAELAATGTDTAGPIGLAALLLAAGAGAALIARRRTREAR